MLAQRLGLDFRDTDVVIEELDGRGRRAGDILTALGEPAFRMLEERALDLALRPGRVVATGGGCVEHAGSRARLAGARCVWLKAEPSLLAERMRADPTPRPALVSDDATDEVSELSSRRDPHYAELAAVAIEVGRDGPESIAEQIECELRRKGLH